MTKEIVRWTGSTICDFCQRNARDIGETFVDGKTIQGPWALMCVDCHTDNGISKMGPGYGQAYDSATLRKVAG